MGVVMHTDPEWVAAYRELEARDEGRARALSTAVRDTVNGRVALVVCLRRDYIDNSEEPEFIAIAPLGGRHRWGDMMSDEPNDLECDRPHHGSGRNEREMGS